MTFLPRRRRVETPAEPAAQRPMCACKKPGTELEPDQADDAADETAEAAADPFVESLLRQPLELPALDPEPAEDPQTRWRNAREEVLRCRRVLEAAKAAEREARASLDFALADLELASAGLEHAARKDGLR